MKDAVDRLAEAIEAVGDGLILAVTGAGVSQASGIPTFRGADPEAIWRRSDVELATRSYFDEDPVGQWSWYLNRFRSVDSARPNPAHHALADLERWQQSRDGRFLLVTQNIDCLHEQAGSGELIKVHGSSDRLRCSRPYCDRGAPSGSIARSKVNLEPFTDSPSLEHLPRCPECNGLLRAHVLFFDEYYGEHVDYRFEAVETAARESGLVIFAGTSFSVGVTELVLWGAIQRRVPVFSIDPASPSSGIGPAVEVLPYAAEELLPAVHSALEERLGGNAAADEG